MQFVRTAHSVIHLTVQHRRLKSKKDERGQLRFFLTPDLSTSQSVDFEEGIVFRVVVFCVCLLFLLLLFSFILLWGGGGGRFVCVHACVRACVCVSWVFFWGGGGVVVLLLIFFFFFRVGGEGVGF